MHKWIRNFNLYKVNELEGNKFFKIITNKAVLYPTVLQLFTALSPLVFFRYVFQSYSPTEIINVELLFVFNAFCAVITSWSSTLFLSRIYQRIAKSGAFSSILFNRIIIVSCIILVFYCVQNFTHFVPGTIEFLLALFLVLFAQVFDPSWFYIGQKKLYVPQLQLICQYCAAFIFCYYDAPILLAIGFSWLIVSICFFIPVAKFIKLGPVRPSLSLRIIRRYSLPTFSEIATSLFSKLDVLYASVLLTPSNAVVYILLRKHILAAQSIIFASIRLLYLERDPEKLANIQLLIRIYIALVCTLGVLAISFSISVLFNYNMSRDDLIALIIFAAGIPLGFYKVQVQLQYAYINGLFRLDLLATFCVFLMYLSCIGLFSFLFADLLILLVLARITNDIVYLGIMYLSRLKWSFG